MTTVKKKSKCEQTSAEKGKKVSFIFQRSNFALIEIALKRILCGKQIRKAVKLIALGLDELKML